MDAKQATGSLTRIVFGAKAVDATDPLPVTLSGSGGTWGAETTNTPATPVVLSAATSGTLKTATTGRITIRLFHLSTSPVYLRKADSPANATTAFDDVIPASDGITPSWWESDPYEWAGEIRGYSVPGTTVYVSESV
jgi:hypothetical protein